MAKRDPATDPSLQRLGGGRWQSRDGRFTIEPQSGAWSVVDASQTDELGMALVRGPFGSLTAARAAIDTARAGEAPISPLAARIEEARERPRPAGERPVRKVVQRGPAGRGRATPPDATQTKAEAAGAASAEARVGRSAVEPSADPAAARTQPLGPARPPRTTEAPGRPAKLRPSSPPPEPAWMDALPPDRRRLARSLIERLGGLMIADAQDLARAEVVDDEPALVRRALARRLDAVRDAHPGSDAVVDALVTALVEGDDEGLGVRWRLVDGEGRSIGHPER